MLACPAVFLISIQDIPASHSSPLFATKSEAYLPPVHAFAHSSHLPAVFLAGKPRDACPPRRGAQSDTPNTSTFYFNSALPRGAPFFRMASLRPSAPRPRLPFLTDHGSRNMPASPLESTLPNLYQNKALTAPISLLESTLTKNRGAHCRLCLQTSIIAPKRRELLVDQQDRPNMMPLRPRLLYGRNRGL